MLCESVCDYDENICPARNDRENLEVCPKVTKIKFIFSFVDHKK